MNLSCKEISSNSMRDTGDMKKEPIFSESPNTPLGRQDRSTAHTRVCVPDAAVQMIGNANKDSCRTALIVPYEERPREFIICSRLHLENLVIMGASSFFGFFPAFQK